MFGIGISELVVVGIFILAIILFGPKKIREAAFSFGAVQSDYKKGKACEEPEVKSDDKKTKE